MKTGVILAPPLLAFAALGCSKDKKSDDTPNSHNPGISSVAPAAFKNTAKNGGDVADRMDAVHAKLSQGSFALKGTSSPKMSGPKMVTERVAAFLSAKPVPGPDGDTQGGGMSTDLGLSGVHAGDDCAALAGKLDQSYTQALDGLKETAQSLRDWDTKPLPDGVTKLPPSDKFALAYQIDVKHVIAQIEQQGQSQDGFHLDGPFQPGDLTGSVTFGVGADTGSVGAEVDATINAARDQASVALDLGTAAYADEATATMKLHSYVKADVKAPASEGQQGGSGHVSADVQATLTGGATPALAAAYAVSAEGTGQDGKPAKVDALVTVKLTKTSADTLALEYTNGNEHRTLTLSNDAEGVCKVQEN